MRFNFPSNVICRINRTINKYGLLEDNESVVVGLSGGKDSMVLALALKELGYSVIPVIVDIGFDKKWMSGVLRVCRKINLDFDIISVHDKSIYTEHDFAYISERYSGLVKGINSQDRNITPCTQCYNVKVVAISSYCYSFGIKKIALGHHYNDAVVSFLKNVFYYIDRWYDGNKVFELNRFCNLIDRLKNCFICSEVEFQKNDIYNKINWMVENQLVSTEEPPRSKVFYRDGDIEIVRPLFDVYEHDIEAIAVFSIGDIRSQKCLFRRDGEVTPREIIKKNIVDVLSVKKSDLLNGTVFSKLIMHNISGVGRLVYDVRNNRGSVFGEGYKKCSDEKKL